MKLRFGTGQYIEVRIYWTEFELGPLPLFLKVLQVGDFVFLHQIREPSFNNIMDKFGFLIYFFKILQSTINYDIIGRDSFQLCSTDKGQEGLNMRFIIALAVFLVGGCSTNQEWGTLLGAGAGATLGSAVGSGSGQLASVAGGTLIGAAVGSNVGANMDRQQNRQQVYSAPLPPPRYGHRGPYENSPGIRYSSSFNYNGRGQPRFLKGLSDGIDTIFLGGLTSLWGQPDGGRHNTYQSQNQEIRDDYRGVRSRTYNSVHSNTEAWWGSNQHYYGGYNSGWDW